MPALVNIPTETFTTRAQMTGERALTPWNQNRFVIILDDELYGGGMSLSIYRAEKFITYWAEKMTFNNGLPPGGNTMQMLVKNSPLDFDAKWIDIPISSGETFRLLLSPGTKLLIKPGVYLKI